MPDERARPVAGRKSLAFWALLFGVSSFLVVGSLVEQIIIIWIIIVLAIAGPVAIYRVISFSRLQDNLISNGKVLDEYSYSKQTWRLFLLVLFVIVTFLVPLILAGFLGFGVWFASLLGAIDGWLLHIVIYNAYLLRWESLHQGKLFTVQIWNGSRVTHTGIEFEKNSMSTK